MANYTILLIDYEPRSIERFRDPLTAAGYTVEIATDGVSGIEAFHRLNPDMVLVEAMIPKKHGFEVCQELKRTPHGRRTPVIITTGVYKGRKYRTQALHIYGCDEYIEKPIAPEQLLEMVGKFFVAGSSGSSGPSNKGTESGPVTSEPGAGPAARSKADTIARPAPATETRASGPARTNPISVAPEVFQSDTEDEIMARLDEILPGSRPAPTAARPKPIAVAPTTDQNPFAQMRAELDAELGAITGPLAFEIAPNLMPLPEPFPSDQAMSPSVLEALPTPDAGIPVAPAPAEIPLAKEEQPGQVVSFDTNRSRKNRKSEKKAKGSSSHAGQAAPVSKAPTPLKLDPPMRAAEAAAPRGTIVESEIKSTPARRGRWAVLLLAAAAVALAAVYLVFPRGDASSSSIVPPPKPIPKRATIAPPVAEPNPPASAPAETVAQTPEPVQQAAAPPTAVPEQPKPAPVAVALKGSAPKKSPDRATATTTPAQAAAASRKASVTAQKPANAPSTVNKVVTQESAASEHKGAEAAAVPPPAAAAPAETDAKTGVESSADAAPAPAATKTARGTLIPIDLADTLPVPMTHRSPFYSTEAIQSRITGTVIMNVLINDHGTVDQVVLVSGVTGGDVNDAAIRAAKSWTYRPATKDGVPVKVWRSEQIVVKP